MGVTLLHPHGQIYAYGFVPQLQARAAEALKECTACGFWDTGLKPTPPERAFEAVAGDTQPG